MQVPQIRTVITTGQSIKNTYNQLAALQQEKRTLEYDVDQMHFHSSDHISRDSLAHIEQNINGLNRQIRQIQSEQSFQVSSSSDHVTISDTAYNLLKNNSK
ncbi:hypothetical protein [Sporolactobacillus laevolacticus]|uniref:hypothetical protein n=1 Tax=Sporolactobacillus laevolacticus TaxID=33018 RepID=UPI0025B3AC0A|nr:hypothetical protein [Sporolactobacillus laevolacticus]MDN3953685.1 hypothetical protein [Sporolactobacillus laevolacticus]